MTLAAAIWKNDVRHYLIALNFVAFTVLIVYLLIALLSPKRARVEERPPPNLTPFYEDEDLEGRRLERVQGWALIFAAAVALALPLYWLREPTRQNQQEKAFEKSSEERGASLYAQQGTEHYDSASSLGCAQCHGNNGEGGVAPWSIKGERISWKAPPLNTVLLRFSDEEVRQIITYGRPGTPMAAWGVAGGGPKNEQSIEDLVAFLASIQITKAEAQTAATDAVAAASKDSGACPSYVSCPAIAVADAEKTLAADSETLTKARAAVQEKLAAASASDTELETSCEAVREKVPAEPGAAPPEVKEQALACGEFLAALAKVRSDRETLEWAREWQQRRTNVSEGQLLFELNCARCHTEGWSVFDATAPPSRVIGVDILGLAGGGGGRGGGIGFNLRDGGVIRRFGTDEDGGWKATAEFVREGSEANKEYGRGGIGSGRMPGFGSMLTDEQIARIVSYVRYCLDGTDFHSVSPQCETGTESRTPPTTSTTVAKG